MDLDALAFTSANGAAACARRLVALVGQVLHQQVIPLDLDALGNIVAVTGTNALTLTFGAL